MAISSFCLTNCIFTIDDAHGNQSRHVYRRHFDQSIISSVIQYTHRPLPKTWCLSLLASRFRTQVESDWLIMKILHSHWSNAHHDVITILFSKIIPIKV